MEIIQFLQSWIVHREFCAMIISGKSFGPELVVEIDPGFNDRLRFHLKSRTNSIDHTVKF